MAPPLFPETEQKSFSAGVALALHGFGLHMGNGGLWICPLYMQGAFSVL